MVVSCYGSQASIDMYLVLAFRFCAAQTRNTYTKKWKNFITKIQFEQDSERWRRHTNALMIAASWGPRFSQWNQSSYSESRVSSPSFSMKYLHKQNIYERIKLFMTGGYIFR